MDASKGTRCDMWTRIESFPGYAVSRDGKIMNVARGNLLNPSPNERGYYCVNLRRGGKLHRVKLHRLIASAFCENAGFCEVNHKDGDKANNSAGNLEWCSRSHNLRHSYRELGRKLSSEALASVVSANSGHRNHGSKRLFLNGEPVTCLSIGEKCGRSKSNVSDLLCRGLTPEQIVSLPKYHRAARWVRKLFVQPKPAAGAGAPDAGNPASGT